MRAQWTISPDGDATWEVPESWAQGRSLFGGLTVAAGAARGRLALASKSSGRRLRTVQAQLLGPVTPGVLEGRAQVLREGKTTTFVAVELEQEGSVRAALSLIYIEPREGAMSVPGPAAPAWDAPERFASLPFLPGVTPEFTKHLDFRFAEGTIPFQGGSEASFGGYIRFREAPPELLAEHQLALLDAWPCPTLSLLDRPAFASTVTWTAHLFAPSAPGFHRFTYETVAAESGFSTCTGQLFDSTGRLVGLSEQLVVVFD